MNWKFHVEQTDFTITASSSAELRVALLRYCREKNIEFPTKDEFDKKLCPGTDTMKLWIKDKSSTPPEGWLFYVEQTDFTVRTGSYNTLWVALQQHLRANNIEMPTKDEFDKKLCETLTIPCYTGRLPMNNKFGKSTTVALPRESWPLWARALALIAKPEDKGLGDVIARTIGPDRSEAFKAWYKTTFGVNCGCQGRQTLLNRTYQLDAQVNSE